jgi:succinate dehydrogenase / fumarate reductase, cytochrome b subunit
MNHYAETLHGNPALLWTARTILLLAVVLHIWASVQLALLKTSGRL